MAEAACDEGELALYRQFLRWAGSHCVAVGWEDAERGQPDATGGIAFSAFIMSVRGLWFLVTAGHIIEDINTRLGRGRELRYAKIVDAWSEGNIDKNAIPFPDIIDQSRIPQGYVHQESTGLDYAWFFVPRYYRHLLEANGIVPLDEEAWRAVPEQLDAYGAFGFPDRCVIQSHDDAGAYRGLRIRPLLIPYSPEPNPPADFRLKYRRLFFWPSGQPDGSVSRVDGMSGGPVFGYSMQGNEARLWLVGVQSAQLESGLAIVCPAEPFGRSFEEAMEVVAAERALNR